MADEIRCPMCGKPNPAELDVCQYCEARLKPLTDALSRSQPPIHPGEEPTEQDTGQLEPILPQWLREIRQQARESAEENDEKSAEQAPAEKEAQQPEEPADLLAGLQSQSEEDDEIPDWLAGLRGEGGKVAEEETSTEEDDLAALKSMLGEDAPVHQESEPGDLPEWISDLDAEEQTDETAQAESEPSASGVDFEWGADFESESTPQEEAAEDDRPFDTDLPAWLQGMGETQETESEGIPPAEMAAEEPSSDFVSEEAAPPASEGDLPDWLASLDTEEEAAPQEDMEQPEAQSTTDWLSSLGEETAETAEPQDAPEAASEGELPDWISSLGEESAEGDEQQAAEEPPAAGDIPDWASLAEEEGGEEPAQQETQPTGESELPAWLSSLGGEETLSEDEEPTPTADFKEEAQPTSEEEMPDWLSSIGEESTEAEQPSELVEASAVPTDQAADEDELTPPFVDDEGRPISSEDVESLFSMEMPDWLSDSEGGAEEGAEAGAAGTAGDVLDPGELPEWVQAMRPVESVISETEGETLEEQPMEEEGPLAGLRGVLPAVPGVGPSSVPKAYSIKLQASAEQQANATMLEQILVGETQPKPVSAQKMVLTQRILRWVIAALIILVVGGSIFSGTQINQMPNSAPLETSAALNYIQNSLPMDAPVLLIFDYEAAFSGELEASAAPLVDHMLTLKAPRLSLISSTPTGTGLAERFMAYTQGGHGYERNQQFINLGYLPGGAAGVLAFSENPMNTKPYTTTGENAWETPALQGVGKLSDFAAIILMTNDIETARVWIEQTELTRGNAQLLVVSSAQSGPMIMPYYQSDQVDGMVIGLDGSAPIEQVNSGRPGMVRRYWDAYGFGLLTATALIVLGSLWSLFSSWRVGRKEQVES